MLHTKANAVVGLFEAKIVGTFLVVITAVVICAVVFRGGNGGGSSREDHEGGTSGRGTSRDGSLSGGNQPLNS